MPWSSSTPATGSSSNRGTAIWWACGFPKPPQVKPPQIHTDTGPNDIVSSETSGNGTLGTLWSDISSYNHIPTKLLGSIKWYYGIFLSRWTQDGLRRLLALSGVCLIRIPNQRVCCIWKPKMWNYGVHVIQKLVLRDFLLKGYHCVNGFTLFQRALLSDFCNFCINFCTLLLHTNGSWLSSPRGSRKQLWNRLAHWSWDNMAIFKYMSWTNK